ncbi:MAG TPA: CHAT domain-containing protein, partial [Burkholderiales bacterium]|nr:CHAT domain-containing protein [Burkholderiales bacterium]
GSSTLGSFGDLRTGDRDLWVTLERHFTGGIYAFEHRTLSESPIENAIELARALPQGAHVSLVSHSRGGLVADLMCLGDFDALIEHYCYAFPGTGDPDPDEAKRVKGELDTAHAEQRDQLRRLAALLREKKLVLQRYVRTASPANGTKLASGNFDLFLSGVLTLIGAVPFFFGSPYYSAFKRVVIEIAKNRTNPHLVPGIEAMLPDSPMARLLRDAPVRPGIQMSVIAGDIEGGNMLKRLGVLLTDFLLFENTDNDLVVDTEAMLAGIAPTAAARVLFDRGADVSHFRYFVNLDTRTALRSWLTVDDPFALDIFRALPTPEEFEAALAAAARAARAVEAADRPVVVVLPGVMGSHLTVNGKDRVWLDPVGIAAGGLSKIEWGRSGVEAEELFGMSYGEVCQELAKSHRVEPFPYDWRQPLDVLAERLGEFLDQLMKQTEQPIRLLAHSMGGLVVRACIYKRRPVMDALMARSGARLIMCGTPHQGAHSMVENLIGKGDTLRTLVRLDLKHDMQQVLDIVAGFRGPLQLLPRPGFKDIFQGQPEGGEVHDYGNAQTWVDLKARVRDFWFGDHRCGTPGQDVLDAASWLWQQDNRGGDGQVPSLPHEYESKSVYVFGVARNTPCGVREEAGRLKMVGTTRGDGTVSWESGRIGGIGAFYYMPAVHGDLLGTRDYFPALVDLLASGATARLSTQPPAARAIEQPAPVSYDAGPPTADDARAIERGVMGGSLRNRVPARAKRRLEIAVKAMDLRFLSDPIMVGHYEQDPIAGPEALIDRELLDGDLGERYNLGLYAGPRGTAVVVLRELSGYGELRGAVVTGLGKYDGALSMADLTDAVRTGAMRYLLQIVDVLGKNEREVRLATLLLGYNSSANLTVAASVEALVRGVMEANERFYETTRLKIHIGRLDIVELYLDTAITAVYALRRLSSRMAAHAEKHGASLVARPELEQGEGVRQRLLSDRNLNYWPRMIVTDADRRDDICPPECYDARRIPERYDDRGLGGDDTNAGGSAEREGPKTMMADRLRFLYVGQRARAESLVQQRQPGLIEKLVRQQIANPAWQEDFGRMLFQLMVPHELKDPARQLDRVVLVVDSYTANLPWELMLADDPSRTDDDKRPLALRTAVVRQLSSSQFRRQVRQGLARNALVIGNPSVEGFERSFLSPKKGEELKAPPDLPGAQKEAEEVVNVLRGLGYDVSREIGKDRLASDVMAALYRKPYRILHISAHGVFDLRHRDGRSRSGVLLSDGLLITAAEIAAMETVPELVFLNCCHLGQIDVGRDANKLAASVSRELIEIGVRCVIVAGWAVNDENASLFGQSFYEQLLLQRQPFGDAVFQARQAAWEHDATDITWGAFQAYGDAGWRAEARTDGSGGTGDGGLYASPEELLDDLASTRAELARKADRQTEREMRALVKSIEQKLKTRCPPSWLQSAQIQSALGATWRDLGKFEEARAAFLKAIQADDKAGRVPIRDIEQLANVEARLGERRAQAALDAGTQPPGESPESLIELALNRLNTLDALVSATTDPEHPSVVPNAERSALRGSALKRKASLYARRILHPGTDPGEIERNAKTMLEAIKAAAAAYATAEGTPGSGRFAPYLALNRLALDALTIASSDAAAASAGVALAQQCRLAASQAFARSGDVWDAVMQGEALLVERLLDRRLTKTDDDGLAAFDEVVREYDEALGNIPAKPSQVDSVITQLELLSRFYDALSVAQNDPSQRLVADRLLELVQRILPGRPPRSDRPAAVERTGARAPVKRARRPSAKQPGAKRRRAS